MAARQCWVVLLHYSELPNLDKAVESSIMEAATETPQGSWITWSHNSTYAKICKQIILMETKKLTNLDYNVLLFHLELSKH